MLAHFFDVNAVFLTVMGYPLSYIECFGTLLNLWSVWLTARNKVLSWPVGLVAVVLFFILFYQIRLYSDMVEQAYFFVTGFWGWWVWTHPKRGQSDATGELKIAYASNQERLVAFAATALGTLALGAFMTRVHLILPAVFAQPADFPYMDAFTTVMSFTATILMIRKRIECWWLWILVDLIGIWLYFAKGMRFIALEYIVFLILASGGLFKWMRLYGKASKTMPPASGHAA